MRENTTKIGKTDVETILQENESKYGAAIRKCIANTCQYPSTAAKSVQSVPLLKNAAIRYKDMSIRIVDSETVPAIADNAAGKTCVLNFAAYKQPGGSFTKGGNGQEEHLCRNSILYNVLLAKDKDYYKKNQSKANTNRGMYYDTCLYTPDIVFYTGESTATADVITCSAPDKRASMTCANVSAETHHAALVARIRFILLAANSHYAETLILGAFGCGRKKQDPNEIAEVFMQLLCGEFKGAFKSVVFAIPDKESANYIAFERAIEAQALC